MIKHLKTYFNFYSRPIRIISDRGCVFTSAMFQEFVEEQSIQLVHIATGIIRANGQAEMVNHTILPMIPNLTLTLFQWDKTLSEVEYVVNNTINRLTNEVPTILLYDIKQLGNPVDKIKIYLDSYVTSSERDLKKLRQNASNCIEINQQQSKTL